MNETLNKNTDLKGFLLKTLLDPVLIYAAVAMTSIMYHYRSQLALIYGIAAYISGWMIFRLFDFINRHKLIGSAAYIALFFLFMFATRTAIDEGRYNYPIPWGVWFLTPQDSLEYNRWYTLAIYLLFLIFMLSVIYYFTRVRYRVFMNFLIFIIPFAIYGKEFEKMPTVYIILLSVGYILLMVYFRQLYDNEKTVIVAKDEAWKTVAVYAVIFAVAAAVIPKPAVEADRTVLETLISAEQFTDRLVEMLNVFRDTTSSDQFRTQTDNTPIYIGYSNDSLRLKTSTFSTYDFNHDSWSIMDKGDGNISLDTTFSERFDAPPFQTASAGELANAIISAAEADSSFAEKYGLSELVGTKIRIPQEKKVFLTYVADQNSQFAPVPQYSQTLSRTSYRNQSALIYSGLIYSVEDYFKKDTEFEFTYSSEDFFLYKENAALLRDVDISDYREMLKDAESALWNANYDDSKEDYSDEQWYHYWDILWNEAIMYRLYTENLLDYGENIRIRELAEELTDGVESDYEKAKILESYFYDNDNTYDLGYVKKSSDNAETFIFESKTGVCYEYATAMVLLARAAGIPARYCEGYNMNQVTENSSDTINEYLVTSQSAHGFPELYIRGYGWVSFEPTMTDIIIEKTEKTTTNQLTRAGVMILIAALAVLVGILVYPSAAHKVFLIIVRRRTPDDVVIMVMRRICRLCRIGNANTSKEAAKIVFELTGNDITNAVKLFDKHVYGEISITGEEKDELIRNYIEVYTALREKKKMRSKKA